MADWTGNSNSIYKTLGASNHTDKERQNDDFYATEPDVSNRALWRIEPYFDGISTAVTTYKVVDQNGTLQYMGDRNQCEYFIQHGC